MKPIKKSISHSKTDHITGLGYYRVWAKNTAPAVLSKSNQFETSIGKQQGVILISVLVIVALISVSVTLMLKRQNTMIDDITVVNHQDNAIQYLLSLEDYAKELLKTDLEEDGSSRVDSYDEEDKNEQKWHDKIPNVLDNVRFDAQIFDLQAGLNLNNLFEFSKKSGQIKERVSPDFFGCFNRLNLALDSNIVGDSIINYLNAERLQKITHPSELRGVGYIEDEDYQKIRPFVFALDKPVAININTASAEVLACLHPQLESETVIEDIESARPYERIDDFYNQLQEVIPSLSLAQIKARFGNGFVDVKSGYFKLISKVTIGQLVLNATSIFRRNGSIISLIHRSYYLDN